MISGIQDRIRLTDGGEMPAFGLGCYLSKGDDLTRAIRYAAEVGYRHFDTAAYYENEDQVGRAVRCCGVPRDALFVVTKIWPLDFTAPQKALERALTALDLEYLDAVLLHWPGTDADARLRAWETLLEARQKGLIRHAGVSNFLPRHLGELADRFGEMPAMNQIELHPWRQQRELCAFCREQKIPVTAWGPLFHGHLAEEPLMGELGEKYGKSPAQIALRWDLQHGFCTIPKSVTPERILANTKLFDFAISPDDMARIDGLDGKGCFSFDPDTFDGNC